MSHIGGAIGYGAIGVSHWTKVLHHGAQWDMISLDHVTQ